MWQLNVVVLDIYHALIDKQEHITVNLKCFQASKVKARCPPSYLPMYDEHAPSACQLRVDNPRARDLCGLASLWEWLVLAQNWNLF